jgi:hypothetical protein
MQKIVPRDPIRAAECFRLCFYRRDSDISPIWRYSLSIRISFTPNALRCESREAVRVSLLLCAKLTLTSWVGILNGLIDEISGLTFPPIGIDELFYVSENWTAGFKGSVTYEYCLFEFTTIQQEVTGAKMADQRP